MPIYIQFSGIGIVLFFHTLPIFASAVIYAALLNAVNKIQLQNEQNIKVDSVIMGIDNRLCNLTKDHMSVQENSICEQSLQNIESSVHNSRSNNFRKNTEEDEVPIHTISYQNTKKLQSIPTRVICIDSEFMKKEQRNDSSTTRISKTKSDNTITKKKKKEEIEKLAALRSMKTNLLMVLMFAALGLFTLVPTMKWKLFLFILFETILKCMLPIITTLSNFGPVKNVAKMYLNLIN